MSKTKYITIKFTELEFASLIDCIDTVSALSDQLDEGETKKDVKRVDRALKRHNFKRKYT